MCPLGEVSPSSQRNNQQDTTIVQESIKQEAHKSGTNT